MVKCLPANHSCPLSISCNILSTFPKPRLPDDLNPWWIWARNEWEVRAGDGEMSPPQQEGSLKCSGGTSGTSSRPLGKRSYEGKGRCILKAEGQGWTRRLGGSTRRQHSDGPQWPQEAEDGTVHAPSWYQDHSSLSSASSAPGNRSGAQQGAEGVTIKGMETAPLVPRREASQLPSEALLSSSPPRRRRQAPPALRPHACSSQSHAVAVSFIPGLLLEKHDNHHF